MERNYALAHKYARAFMRVYGRDLEPEDIRRGEAVAKRLARSKEALLLVDLTQKVSATASESMVRFLDQFGVNPHFHRIVGLLARDRRLSLMPEVLDSIVALYQDERGIVPCVVTSAQPLTSEQHKAIEQAIKDKVSPKTADITYALDKSLIGGVRIQIDLLIGEYSVAQHARRIRNALAEV